jgi:hypothetical protein
MKEFLRLSTVFAALAASGSTHGGFLDPAPAYPVPAPGYPGYPVKSANTIPPVYDWTGLYAGINDWTGPGRKAAVAGGTFPGRRTRTARPVT